ncbi:MAG: helix-turn-helix domain-containing protein [Chromatiaceae bacterium]|nr:helix-turn-helix domain-containing protein [Chromatiaceae bacterium]MBP9603053.1 helix-turn-helix domain-containing protein [Chromatiaceae bacterium]
MLTTEERPRLSVDDVAARLQVNRKTVRRWIRSGKLRAVKAGRQHRVAHTDLALFLRSAATSDSKGV